ASFVGNVLAVRKDTYQTSTTTTLVNVDDLTLNLEANTNYTIEGALFAIASSTTPDLSIAFEIPSGATMDIGYVGGYDAAARDADVLSASGVGSSRIELDATYPTIIQINGTIKMGSTDGNVILKWGQAQSNLSNILIKPGSYLRAQGI
ncbi:MAG TPA: hypothetical protein VHT73_12945, partial [Thermodesulfobacteriota bacterium]|nr:hypothetical protein [Thermodesulfobacteriota bacterium]